MAYSLICREVPCSETSTNSNEKEARNRIIEKKPPMAAISLGTDVDAPRGEKMETSRKYYQ